MNQIDRRRCDMLIRVRDFGATFGHLLPGSSLAQPSFAAVAAAVAELEAHDLAEAAASVSARATRKAAARRRLLELLARLAHTARVLAEENPQVKARFELPDPIGDQALLTVARQFANEAAGGAAEFVAHGLPVTFHVDLEQLIGHFEAALRERGTSRDEQVAARARITASIAAALATVRKLDVIVANHLAADPVTCAVWKRCRRVGYPQGRRGAAKPPVNPAAPEPAPTGQPASDSIPAVPAA